MTDGRRHHGEEDERDGPRRIKVTDKRRVRDDRDEPRTVDPRGPVISTAPKEPVVGTAEPAGGEEDLQARLAKAERQAEEYRDHLVRLQAEFDNYRKRVLKEQTRAVEMASEPLVRRLLEVLDEFDLALMQVERTPEVDRFLRGVELVYAKLKDILRADGLEQIDALGKPFDPEVHEALMGGGDGEGEPVVVDVLRPGYTLKGRVIRPVGVRVEQR